MAALGKHCLKSLCPVGVSSKPCFRIAQPLVYSTVESVLLYFVKSQFWKAIYKWIESLL
jgi:hypothetical protein